MRLNTYIQGEGLPILCLHGHPGSGDCMSVFTEVLSGHFQAIAPDLRGYGQSMTNSPFTMGDHLDDLIMLIDDLQLDNFILLGWSLGGILAIELALKFPERVQGLILIASSACPWGSHPKISFFDNLNTVICSLINKIKPGWEWNINTFGKRSLYRYLIQQHHFTAYNYLANQAFPAYLQTSKFAHNALNQALSNHYNKLTELSQIICPSLILAGECDRHITPQSSLMTANALPKAKFICYDQTAHLFPWEIPTKVHQDIMDFLQNLSNI
jgi:pimeloyl-ACP methyl ester carboxylesterase